MEQKNYNINLLNIQDKNIIVKKIKLENNIYSIYLKQIKSNDLACPNCGSASFKIKSYYTRTIKAFPIHGLPSLYFFKQIRFICDYCAKTFNQPTSIVSNGCTISKQLKDNLLNESSFKQSFKDIAAKSYVSQTTVSNEFKKQLHNYRGSLSRILCIDEFKASTIAGTYALIIGNPESGQILDILPSRLQDYIYYYFNSIPESERFSVEYVVTDLFESYRTICKNLFWKSIHIADRFHWIKLSTEAFNKIRIRIMKLYLNSKEKIKSFMPIP